MLLFHFPPPSKFEDFTLFALEGRSRVCGVGFLAFTSIWNLENITVKEREGLVIQELGHP